MFYVLFYCFEICFKGKFCFSFWFFKIVPFLFFIWYSLTIFFIQKFIHFWQKFYNKYYKILFRVFYISFYLYHHQIKHLQISFKHSIWYHYFHFLKAWKLLIFGKILNILIQPKKEEFEKEWMMGTE